MNKHRNALVAATVFLAALAGWTGVATAQSGLDQLPEGWQSQAFGDFIDTMHAAVDAGMSDADRALAASQWMDTNDWQSGSRKHRVQLVELLDSDLLNHNAFSVRWTGFLAAGRTDTYRLSLWDYYPATSMDTKIWINDALVLDCSGPEEGRVFETEGIELTAGQRVPIRVEFSFDSYRSGAKHARPNVVLYWSTDTLDRQIIPSVNLQPPDDYIAEGTQGLKGEYFSTSTFGGLVQTRLDPQLGFLWHYFAVAPAYGDRQRQIVEPMVPEILASLDDPSVVGMEQADAFWCSYALEEVLTTQEAIQILQALQNRPALNAARGDRDLFLMYSRFRYLPGHLATDLAVQWCKANPQLACQPGVYGNYRVNEFYGNYKNYWKLGRHLKHTHEGDYAQASLAEADGSCNLSLARILTFYHRESRTMEAWSAYLELQAEAPGVMGDAKATWLIARAFAEDAKQQGEPFPLAGRQWLEDALTEASSESMRLFALQELVYRLASLNKGGGVDTLLAEHEEKFPSEAAQQRFAEWRQSTDDVAARFLQQKRGYDTIVQDLYVKRLAQRRDEATARGDEDTATRYQEMIQEASR